MQEFFLWFGVTGGVVFLLLFLALVTWIAVGLWTGEPLPEREKIEYQPLPKHDWSRPCLDAFEDFWNQQAVWSQKTFGPDNLRGPAGPLKHILREILTEMFGVDREYVNNVIKNLEANKSRWNLNDSEEYADLGFLVVDAARRKGFLYDSYLAHLFLKLDKNKNREWPPFDLNKTEDAVEHVRAPVRPAKIGHKCLICKVPATKECDGCHTYYCEKHAAEHGGIVFPAKMLDLPVDEPGAAG